MAVRIMSDKELARFEVLRDLDHERLTAQAAADILGLSRRQALRLFKAYRTCGVDGLISKQRGRPSNRRKPDDVRVEALAIIRERYADFGPTLAAEKLRELHDICLGRETVRLWMAEAGIWATRKKRRSKVYQPRYRRDCVGELIQIDGSEHRWFEDRGPMCTLLVFIDDATSRLMHLQFVETESTFSYFAATKAYLEAHGKPVAFYSDKHSVFRVAKPGVTGDGMTQFGRALNRLKIEICANSSQAKGRVERANKTLQDRLVEGTALGSCQQPCPTVTLFSPPSSLTTMPVSAKLPPTLRIYIGPCHPAINSMTSSHGKRNAPSPSPSPFSTTRCCSSWSRRRPPRRRSANGLLSSIIQTGGSPSATRGKTSPTEPSIRSARSTRPPSWRTSGLVRCWR